MRFDNEPALFETEPEGIERDRAVILFEEAKTANESRRREIVSELGALVRRSDEEHFERLLRTVDLTGDHDVTGWPRFAVRSLLVVCAESKTWITVRNGERLLSPVSFPKEGPLLEMFVDAVMTG